MKCNNCDNFIFFSFLNLGKQPLANRYLKNVSKIAEEKKYPLKVYFCKKCKLIQTGLNIDPKNIFEEDYAYLSSTSEMWLAHANEFVENILNGLKIDQNDYVIEIASNDGYLLQYFKDKNIKSLGVEPTRLAHDLAISKGLNSINEFFDIKLARSIISQHGYPKLIIANNVIAHVPDRKAFFRAIGILCNEETRITMEFHDAVNLIQKKQFDTIYHEHYSYYTLESIAWVLNTTGFYIEKSENLPTHGGSLRVHAKLKEINSDTNGTSINSLPNTEALTAIELKEFRKHVKKIRLDSKKFIKQKLKQGESISGFGAAAKGNTFLNYLKIKYPEIKYVVDNSESKKGKFLPGSHVPIVSFEFLKSNPTDYLIILPWNIYSEIKSECIKNKIKIKLVKFIPEVSVEQI